MERRQHPRVESEIRASVLINGKENGVAIVKDLSASGLGFEYAGNVALGDRVVAHLDGGARLEGRIARLFEGGFAITLELSAHKRQRLSETLDRQRKEGSSMGRLSLERRLAARVTGMQQTVVCETADRRIPARIVDMSLSGVAIEADEEIPMETLVVIGKMRGYIIRRDGNVYGVQFLSSNNRVEEADIAYDRARDRRSA